MSLAASAFYFGEPQRLVLSNELWSAYRCVSCKGNAIERAGSHEEDARECYECYGRSVTGGSQ